jgi:hypothetical protein
MSRLAERFPKHDMEIFKAFEVFNPCKVPRDKDKFKKYGETEVAVLCEQYGKERMVDGVVHAPIVDPTQLKSQWKLFKHTMMKACDDGTTWKQLAEDSLCAKSLPSEIDTCFRIKLVLPYGTSMCERGFSRMKLIKSALRNRLYIETLDALMVLSLVGPSYVTWGDSQFFEEALSHWEKSKLRNPKKARFGNGNATKRRGHNARTQLPVQEDLGAPGESDCFDLDQLADDEEETQENIFCETAPTPLVEATATAAEPGLTGPTETAPVLNETNDMSALVGRFKTPTGYICHDNFGSEVQVLMSNDELTGMCIAYKFESEWALGIHKGLYRGRKNEFQGHTIFYYNRETYYVSLDMCNYGPERDWVLLLEDC